MLMEDSGVICEDTSTQRAYACCKLPQTSQLPCQGLLTIPTQPLYLKKFKSFTECEAMASLPPEQPPLAHCTFALLCCLQDLPST